MFQLPSLEDILKSLNESTAPIRRTIGYVSGWASIGNPVVFLSSLLYSQIDPEFRKGVTDTYSTIGTGLNDFINTVKSGWEYIGEQIKQALPQVGTDLFWIILAIIILIALLR